MPSRSEAQRKMIFTKRNIYGTKANTPADWRWIWDKGYNKLDRDARKEGFKEETTMNKFKTYLEKVAAISEDRYPEDGEKKMKKGDKVIFHTSAEGLGELTKEEWELSDKEYKKLKAHNGEVATIVSIAVDDADDDENPHYLNIKFDDGYEIGACSSGHLKKVKK